MPPGELFGRVSMADRLFIECMCRALHSRNYTHAAPAGADLFFNINPAIYETIAVVEREFDFMLSVLAHYGLGPERLVCEVVETNALDAEALKQLCVKLRMAGLRLALDDFGAGSSSMERFRDRKPDIIKVDGAWFRTMAGERGSRALLGATLRQFRRAGVVVLIEGIETAEQFAIAESLGADLFQGFGLGRPETLPHAFPAQLDVSAPPMAARS